MVVAGAIDICATYYPLTTCTVCALWNQWYLPWMDMKTCSKFESLVQTSDPWKLIHTPFKYHRLLKSETSQVNFPWYYISIIATMYYWNQHWIFMTPPNLQGRKGSTKLMFHVPGFILITLVDWLSVSCRFDDLWDESFPQAVPLEIFISPVIKSSWHTLNQFSP